MDIVWSRVSSASGYRDGVYSVCISGDRVYAVGFDELHGYGRKRYRIEAFRARDGAPVTRWADEKSYLAASLFVCVASDARIYAFGATEDYWSMLVFDRDLNLDRRTDIENPYVIPFSAVLADKYIYVAGTVVTPTGLTALYAVKISATDFSTVSSFVIDMKGSGAGAYAVSYNSRTKQVVVGGFDRSEGSMNWLIVYLTEDLELTRVVKPGVKGSVTGLAIDHEGFIYSVGKNRIIKLGKEGEIIAVAGTPQAVKIYTSSELKTSIGVNIATATDNEIYMLANDTLSIVDSVRLSRGPQMLTTFIGSMDADNDNIYAALTQIVTKDDWNWAIYALRSRGRRIFPKFLTRR